ncbi:hypothetical protein [Rhodoblastus sp.]|uniref:hypothetical protein n=1 Tax=Rhodoblastus sp. TaxID=1962975 RepID=UPI003F9718BF
MTVFASADQVARALVAAAKLLGADPLGAFARTPAHISAIPIARTRYLAYDALRVALPSTNAEACARGVGFAQASTAANIWKIRQAAWWRDAWVDEVVGAILGDGVERPVRAKRPTPSSGANAPPSPARGEGTPPPRIVAPPFSHLARAIPAVPAAKRIGGPPLHLGEPAPGRSALDARRRGEEPEEIQDGRRARPVSLPRIPSLERADR